MTAIRTRAISLNDRLIIDELDRVTGIAPGGGAPESFFEPTRRQRDIVAAAAAVVHGPQFRRAWAPPVAHATTTFIARGESRVNAGHIYTAVESGTTGAGSAPTTTGLAHVTDGSVIWAYSGETFTADADAPTVAIGTSVPAMTRFYRNPLDGFLPAGSTAISSNDWYSAICARLAVTASGIGVYAGEGFGMGAIEFFVDSATFAIAHQSYPNFGLAIAIDGRFIQPTVFHPTGSDLYYYTVTLKERKPRTRVTVYFDSVIGGAPIRGVLVPATGTVWAEEPNFKVMTVGDSFGVPKGPYDFGGHMQLGVCIGAALGAADSFGQCIGGSGYATAVTPATDLYINRIHHIAAYEPDILVIWGSVNDKGQASGVLTSEVSRYLRLARKAAPNALIFVLGISGPADADAIAAELEISAGVGNSRVSDVWFIPVATDPAGPWLESGATGYIGDDTVHMIQSGILYSAARIGSRILQILRG